MKYLVLTLISSTLFGQLAQTRPATLKARKDGDILPNALARRAPLPQLSDFGSSTGSDFGSSDSGSSFDSSSIAGITTLSDSTDATDDDDGLSTVTSFDDAEGAPVSDFTPATDTDDNGIADNRQTSVVGSYPGTGEWPNAEDADGDGTLDTVNFADSGAEALIDDDYRFVNDFEEDSNTGTLSPVWESDNGP